MKIWDYFYLTLVLFQVKVLKRDLGSARYSAFLMVSLWLGWLITATIFVIGLIKRYWLADRIANSILFFALPMGAALVISLLRYYRFVKYPDLKEWKAKMSTLKRWVMYTLFLIILIGVPVLLFVTFRLYKYGYILE